MSAIAVFLVGGCSTINTVNEQAFLPSDHPVTVDSANRNDRLAEIAKAQHPRILATYGGEYSDAKLERMVAKAIGRLTLDPDHPTQTYNITLLNSPSVNAFALPGGYLYVTRGLLALANDSSELAAVIAHEMGHVTANHGLQRQQKEAEEQLATKVVDQVLSGDATARAALIRNKLSLAQFSRNQELEADSIGIKSIGRAGYDPYAAARFLQSMAAYSDFRSVNGAEDPSLDFLASHPSAPQRIELALRHAREFGAPGIGERARDEYLAGIDGMLFGDTPEEGYVRGRTFLHPALGVSFTVPEGFIIDNSAAAVTAAGPGEVAIRFDGIAVDPRTSLTDYLKSGWVAGLDEASVQSVQINGVDTARAQAVSGAWKFDLAVFRSGAQVYRVLTAAPLANTTLAGVAGSVAGSFRLLSPAEKAALKPLRIKVITVRAGDTLAALASKMRGVDRAQEMFRLLNALASGATPSAGDKVKIITDL